MTVGSPFVELNLRHELASQPAAVFHICSCEAYVSTIAPRFREICERATVGLKNREEKAPIVAAD
jgi:hypothetical protein